LFAAIKHLIFLGAWVLGAENSTQPLFAAIMFLPCLRAIQNWIATFTVVFATISATAATPLTAQLYPQFRYDFALIGDTPYDAAQETNYFPNLITELNAAKLAFIVHDGDIKAGATPCSAELFERRFHQFQTIRHPLVYILGDNEWTDCPKVEGLASTQETWLELLRNRFCAGDRSLGKRTMYLERQSRSAEYSAFRENVRWIHGGVLFAGLNVPGSANNYGQPEFAFRNKANLAWLQDAFNQAERLDLGAVMLIIQANPHFEMGATNRLRRGFNEMLSLLETRTVAYRKPVVLVHGDSHYFRIDQPLVSRHSRRRIENFTRVETYGNPDVHWLRVTVDWEKPNVFVFERQLVRANLVKHQP
jgi:hypothetical protein